MKIYTKKYIYIFALMSLFMTTSFVKAEYDNLPDVMVGQTIITYTDDGGPKIDYGGFGGNQVVLNYTESGKINSSATDDGSSIANNLYGFTKSDLDTCVEKLIWQSGNSCFKPSSDSLNSVKTMTSKTYTNGIPVLETAAIIYPYTAMLIGDSYLGNSDLNDFSYWGRNLATTSGKDSGSDSFIGLSGYKKGGDSQATMDIDSEAYNKYLEKINVLQNEAQEISKNSLVNVTKFYLQSSEIANVGIADKELSPEGKVWFYNGNLSLNKMTYSGDGTLIINGNLTINSDIDLANSADRLGLIVKGDVTIAKNIKVRAAIFSTGKITVSGNDNMIGSFVANDFKVNGVNNWFRYDYDLDEAWPPGFRDLQMPRPSK